MEILWNEVQELKKGIEFKIAIINLSGYHCGGNFDLSSILYANLNNLVLTKIKLISADKYSKNGSITYDTDKIINFNLYELIDLPKLKLINKPILNVPKNANQWKCEFFGYFELNTNEISNPPKMS